MFKSVAKPLLFMFCSVFALSAHAQNLVSNGDFEAGLADWTIWSAPDTGFWSSNWIHANDCDIWVPTNGCPNEGSISHSQKKGTDARNAHGGIYQVLSVEAGESYTVSGNWSGGVTGRESFNATWWEVVVYDGAVSDAVIDQAPGPQDTLIAKREVTNLEDGQVFQFQWEPFSGQFVAPSDTVTLAFKQGSLDTFEAAAYHDAISVTSNRIPSIPTLSTFALLVLLGLFALVALRHGPGMAIGRWPR